MAHSPEGGCASVADRAPFDRFYKSKRWQRCRDAYFASRNGLCERCLSMGLITPGDEVHHKQRLTLATLDDPAVALSWDNLELLCKSCHQLTHGTKHARRYIVGSSGEIIAR